MSKEEFAQISSTFLPQQHKTDAAFINRLFNAFDYDRSGEIDFKEFMLATVLTASENNEEKIHFCFRCLDVDNNNHLDREEITYAVSLLFQDHPELNQQPEEFNTPEKVVEQIFKCVDRDNDHTLTADEVVWFMQSNPEGFKNLGLHLLFLE